MSAVRQNCTTATNAPFARTLSAALNASARAVCVTRGWATFTEKEDYAKCAPRIIATVGENVNLNMDSKCASKLSFQPNKTCFFFF